MKRLKLSNFVALIAAVFFIIAMNTEDKDASYVELGAGYVFVALHVIFSFKENKKSKHDKDI